MLASSLTACLGRGVRLCIAALLLALAQQPSTTVAGEIDTITFEPAPLSGGSKLVNAWVEKDIRFSTPSQLVINDISNATFPYDGTAYLQCQFGESPLSITTVDGQPFSLIAVDLAEYSTVYDVPKTITFVGTYMDGTTTSVGFETDGVIDGNGPAQDFQTFTFPATFTGLQRVTVDTDRYSMDNLQVMVGAASATPTPTPTPALLPAITSAAAATAQVNQPFAYQITATHQPTSFAFAYYPSGLTINPGTGLISGVVSAPGSYTLVVSATNATGTGSAQLTLNVSVVAAPTPGGAAPVITSATRASVQAGQPFSYLITATNSPSGYAATGLPDGLSVDAGGGLITGTTNAGGAYNVGLSATNASGTGTAQLTLNVTAPPPSVTVSATGGGVATENGAGGKFVVRRLGSMDADLLVRYKVKGSAKAGVDYKTLNGAVTVPTGTVQAKIKVKPLDNAATEGTRTVKIILMPSADGSYSLGQTTTAKIKILPGD